MKQTTKLTLKTYIKHLLKYKYLVFLALAMVISASVVNTIVPLYFKKFFDILTGSEPKEVVVAGLLSTLVILAILEFTQWALWRFATFSSTYFYTRVIRDLGNTCFAYLHRHSFSFFNNNFVGSLVKRVNRFIWAFDSIFDNVLWNLLPLFVNVTLVVVVLFTRSKIMGIVMLVWIIIFSVINLLLTEFKFKYDTQRAEAETAASGVLADTITNHSNLKLFCGYDRERGLYGRAVEKARKIMQFCWNLENTIEAMQAFLMIILEVGLFYIAIKLWERDLFTVGDFVLLQSYVIIVFMKIWNFGRAIRKLYKDLADAEDMAQIFDMPHEIVDVRNAQDLKIKNGKIEFNDVTFNYHKTRKVIDKLNLIIKPGQKIALVGPSGAGKSTVVKLLLRFFDVNRGKILIDGQRTSRVKMESLWKNISLVPQDPILFHRTLMENIRYGKPEASDKEVMEAAKLAHCHEFIQDLPEQYDTYVGERGVKLSGGERQRVAIARAILRNAPILILDEATSSLDSESEMLIQDALDSLMKKKTVIVVAHRLSTIIKMDRIIVIEGGKIVEDGNHAKLMKDEGGLYRKLWQIQAGGFIK